MSDKYKHSEQLENVLKYMNNTMTDQERYKFERELERDPFLYEAFEGLSEHKTSEIERDIRGIDVISGKRRLSLGFLKYVGYAAGLALLVFAGYWAVTTIDFSKQQTAKNEAEPENIKFMEPYKPVRTDTIDSLTTVDTTRILVADAALNQQTNAATMQVQPPKPDKTVQKETAKKKSAILTADQQTAIKTEGYNAVETVEVAQEFSEESAITAAAAPIDSREDIEEPINALKRPGVNADPQPLGGSTLFKNYLESNAKYPEGIQNAKKEFVKIRFKITKTGEPTSFFIERSPDDSFSQEAIRLIKSGPKWSPEIKDGIPVDGEVTIRINFKPQDK
jgi:protein TonB